MFHLFGGRLDSFKKEGDEFERKETIRRTTRVPVAQTIAEIGEGRGMFIFIRDLERNSTNSRERIRHPTSWLRGTQTPAPAREVWHRDQPCYSHS